MLARKLGQDGLAISDHKSTPDTKKVLAGVDRLAEIAPPAIETDFKAYRTIEHAVLNPGGAASLTDYPAAALEHVASYLTGTCGVQ